jgi:hypothetical protein
VVLGLQCRAKLTVGTRDKDFGMVQIKTPWVGFL